MAWVRPIPRGLLPDAMSVRVIGADGEFGSPVEVRGVRFERTQSACGDAHRSADAGAGTVFVDAVNSAGAFEVPAGSRVEIDDASYAVAACKRCCTGGGVVHHWELSVR